MSDSEKSNSLAKKIVEGIGVFCLVVVGLVGAIIMELLPYIAIVLVITCWFWVPALFALLLG